MHCSFNLPADSEAVSAASRSPADRGSSTSARDVRVDWVLPVTAECRFHLCQLCREQRTHARNCIMSLHGTEAYDTGHCWSVASNIVMSNQCFALNFARSWKSLFLSKEHNSAVIKFTSNNTRVEQPPNHNMNFISVCNYIVHLFVSSPMVTKTLKQSWQLRYENIFNMRKGRSRTEVQ